MNIGNHNWGLRCSNHLHLCACVCMYTVCVCVCVCVCICALQTVEQQLDKDSKWIYPTRFMFSDGKELMIKFQNEINGWQLLMESSKKV